MKLEPKVVFLKADKFEEIDGSPLSGLQDRKADLPNSPEADWRWKRCSARLGIVFVPSEGAPWPPDFVAAFLSAVIKDEEVQQWRDGADLVLWIHDGDMKPWDGGTDGAAAFSLMGPAGEPAFKRVLVHPRAPFGKHELHTAWDRMLKGTWDDVTVDIIVNAINDSGARHEAAIPEMLHSIRHDLFRVIGTIEIDVRLGTATAERRIRDALASFADAGDSGALARRLRQYKADARRDVARHDVVTEVERLISEGRKLAEDALCVPSTGLPEQGAFADRLKPLIDWLANFRKRCHDLELKPGKGSGS